MCIAIIYFLRLAICGGLAKNEVTGAAFSLCSLNKLGHVFLTCGEREFLFFLMKKKNQKHKTNLLIYETLCFWSNANLLYLMSTEEHLRIWNIDIATHKLHVLNASLGKIRRNFTAMKISADDSVIFVGTMRVM